MSGQEAVYIDYFNYDWDSFEEFQQGLSQILENYLENLKENDPSITSIPSLDKTQLIEQAKLFFYCTKTGNILELDEYLAWKHQNGYKFDKNAKILEIKHEDTEPVKLKEIDTETPIEHDEVLSESKVDSGDSNPPYSSNYKELVELILSGKEVPGMKQIPDTVLTEKKSESTKSQRAKPWET